VAQSREFRFVVRCCQSAFADPAACGAFPKAKGLDWSRFLRLARFHRVQGLVWKGISGGKSQVPASVSEALAADAIAIAATNLHVALHCRTLLADFMQTRMPLLFLKGLAVGTLAYGSAGVKSAVDVDLLIAPDELDCAAELLDHRGYILTIPKGDRARLRQWHGVRKESVWIAPDSGVQIDLHTRAADNPQMIPTISADSPARLVDVGNGIELPTLGPTETFAYLAVHGASSAWFRLKWICDFAALLADKSPNELDALYRKSLRLAAGRAPAQALLLADRLFGTLADNAALKTKLLRDPTSRLLYRAALAELAGRPEPIEPTSRRLGTLRIHWTQFLLMPGLRFKGSEFLRQARVPLA
jgi:Uncharacterised nucleotidyltransferase